MTFALFKLVVLALIVKLVKGVVVPIFPKAPNVVVPVVVILRSIEPSMALLKVILPPESKLVLAVSINALLYV